MSPASRRPRRLRPRLAGAAVLLASLAGTTGASPQSDPVPRPRPAPESKPCVATSIDDLLRGDAIDFGRRGFDLRRLGEGFVLQSFAAYSQGMCDEHGEVLGRALTAISSWDHAPSGGQVYVNQQQAAEPTANVLNPDWATFWWRGYAFQVSIYSGCPGPPPDGAAERGLSGPPGVALRHPGRIDAAPREPAARAFRGAPAAPPGPPRALPRLTPPPPCPPSSGDLLVSAIAALAPDLDLECFYRRRDGSWSDLAALGVGDPRAALPPGWVEDYFQLSYLEPPAAGCAGPAPESGGAVSFGANFSAPADLWAGVSAYSLPAGTPPYPGFLDDHSASWSDGSYQYGVGVWSSSGAADRDLVLALAAALDPDFAAACLIETRYLTAAEAVALGFRVAEPPAGFEEVWSQLIAQLPSAGCGDARGPTYGFTWSFFDGSDLGIVALLYRDDGGGGSGGPGVAPPGGSQEGFLSWTDAEGTHYEVYGYSNSGGPGPALELLVEVARSMDPTYGGP